jgi:hypothetical protein
MGNPTQPFPINATSAASQVVPADSNRRYMLIRNYSASQQTMWIAFGVVATCGTNGELEVLPGYAYEFGTSRLIHPNGLVANNETFPQPNCPTEYVSVISGALGAPINSATGGLLVITTT